MQCDHVQDHSETRGPWGISRELMKQARCQFEGSASHQFFEFIAARSAWQDAHETLKKLEIASFLEFGGNERIIHADDVHDFPQMRTPHGRGKAVGRQDKIHGVVVVQSSTKKKVFFADGVHKKQVAGRVVHTNSLSGRRTLDPEGGTGSGRE